MIYVSSLIEFFLSSFNPDGNPPIISGGLKEAIWHSQHNLEERILEMTARDTPRLGQVLC